MSVIKGKKQYIKPKVRVQMVIEEESLQAGSNDLPSKQDKKVSTDFQLSKQNSLWNDIDSEEE